MSGFLPITREEMEARGWDQPDFVYISGDSYVEQQLLLEHLKFIVIKCV